MNIYFYLFQKNPLQKELEVGLEKRQRHLSKGVFNCRTNYPPLPYPKSRGYPKATKGGLFPLRAFTGHTKLRKESTKRKLDYRIIGEVNNCVIFTINRLVKWAPNDN